jgi:ATP-dependent DNA helicase RecG
MRQLPPTTYLARLVHQLCKLPDETEWVEFKHNNSEPQEIGEYLSALANSAAMTGKACGYLVWGVESGTHRIVGTTFSPAKERVGNEALEGWLARLLSPRLNFVFREFSIDGSDLVLLEVPRAFRHPVQFKGQEYIRVGSYKKKLREFPEKERELWRVFDDTPFEACIAVENMSDEEILHLLDYPSYFDLLKLPLPERRDGILDALEKESLICRSEAGHWNVMNLGAILFAKRLADFHRLARKAVRVIVYRNNSRIETVKEQLGTKGYANGFEGLTGYINGLLPSNEVIRQALRETVPMYPELAVRELVANALIHQDFSIGGAGPIVEIFDDRMEISNPGIPLVDPERFLDNPPRSRNEQLAALMRRLGVCEERGSGVDKVFFQIEYFQLPAPVFEVKGDGVCVVLFAHRPLARMDKSDRVRACYQHAGLRYVNREFMTNSSVRQRFGIEQRNSATASRLIKEAVEAGVILPYDEAAAPKQMKYIPWWAGEAGA